jgi:hypothetical protein
MNIIDLEHLEIVSETKEIQGGEGLGIDINDILGRAFSSIKIKSLATGTFGAFAAGGPKILTASSPNNSSVGFDMDYTAIAVGIPPSAFQ